MVLPASMSFQRARLPTSVKKLVNNPSKYSCPVCICLYISGDKIPSKSNLRKEGFLRSQFEETISMVGSKAGRSLKQLVTLRLQQSGSRETHNNLYFLLSFCLALTPAYVEQCHPQWRWGLSLQWTYLDNPSQVSPEVCLQGGSRPCWVDNQY